MWAWDVVRHWVRYVWQSNQFFEMLFMSAFRSVTDVLMRCRWARCEYVCARSVWPCVCVWCSHCLLQVHPQWLPGWRRPGSRGWRRSTAGWRIHQTVGDRTWPTQGWWEEGWEHWDRPWSETLLPWHWSVPIGNREEVRCRVSRERHVCTDEKLRKNICFRLLTYFFSMNLESSGLFGWSGKICNKPMKVPSCHLVDYWKNRLTPQMHSTCWESLIPSTHLDNVSLEFPAYFLYRHLVFRLKKIIQG